LQSAALAELTGTISVPVDVASAFNGLQQQHPFDRCPRDAALLLHLCPMRNLEWKGIPMV